MKHKIETIVITGGIASGKSFVLQCFKRLRYPVFSFDSEIERLYQQDQKLINQIANLFEDVVVNNVVDKSMLSLYLKDERWKTLEKIVHSRVEESFLEYQYKHRNKVVVVEIPLYFETNMAIKNSIVISTVCGVENQIARSCDIRKISKEKLHSILNKQVDDRHRILHSDYIIRTDVNKKNTYKQILKIIGF